MVKFLEIYFITIMVGNKASLQLLEIFNKDKTKRCHSIHFGSFKMIR